MNVHFSLKEKIDKAELIVVGVGGEFEAGFEVLEKTNIYKCFLDKINAEKLDEQAYEWMYPLMLSEGLKEPEAAKELKSAYSKLYDLIKDKNYFIVSLNMDSLLESAGFNPERIVSPCGSYLKLQCENGCHDTIYDGRNYAKAVCELILDKDKKLSDILQEVCDKCDGHLIPNTINALKYNEKGYLNSWDNYQKFLMGTVNKKLLLLEMGVTAEIPVVVVNPFKKMCSLNKKSELCAISLYRQDFAEDINERVCRIFENAVCYLNRI